MTLKRRVERLERDTGAERDVVYFVISDEDKREAEARRKVAEARGERVTVVTIGGIDLARDI